MKKADRLTFEQNGATIEAMKRASRNIIAVGLVLFFALGVLCATLVAPGQSLASVTGCSQNGNAMEMTGCEHPSYLCGLDASSNLIAHGAFSSVRPDDSLKHFLGVAVGDAIIASSNSGASLIAGECNSAFHPGAHKVSIRLFNSTLNL